MPTPWPAPPASRCEVPALRPGLGVCTPPCQYCTVRNAPWRLEIAGAVLGGRSVLMCSPPGPALPCPTPLLLQRLFKYISGDNADGVEVRPACSVLLFYGDLAGK